MQNNKLNNNLQIQGKAHQKAIERINTKKRANLKKEKTLREIEEYVQRAQANNNSCNEKTR